jgi:hypothetical protein
VVYHLVGGHGVKASVVGGDDGASGVELEALEGHDLLLEGVSRDQPVHGHHPLLSDTVRPVHCLTGTVKIKKIFLLNNLHGFASFFVGSSTLVPSS